MVAAATALSLMSISSIAFNKRNKVFFHTYATIATTSDKNDDFFSFLKERKINQDINIYIYIYTRIRWPLARYSS